MKTDEPWVLRGREESRDDSEAFRLRNWIHGISICQDGKHCERRVEWLRATESLDVDMLILMP